MKTLLLACVVLSTGSIQAQYYYKDIMGTRETAELVRQYGAARVQRVLLNSYDADGTRNEAFRVEQVFLPGILKTITRTGDEDGSQLITYLNGKGQVVRTVDSSSSLVASSVYTYNDSGNLLQVHSSSSDASGLFALAEDHLWFYEGAKPVRMLRIKNKIDTTIVQFKTDEAGNIAEEMGVRKGVRTEPVYYYYDDKNRLTDIVRYSNKAGRLLPEYMFEYSAANQVIQKITVPSNNSDYLIWRYQYDTNGLKTKEAVYSKDDKRKQLGRMEYVYSFSN